MEFTETVSYCIVNPDCTGPSRLVGTAHGFTNGDKWRCQKCKSFCVVRAMQLPHRPEKR